MNFFSTSCSPAASRNPLMAPLPNCSLFLPAWSKAGKFEPTSTKKRTAPEKSFMKLLVKNTGKTKIVPRYTKER